MSTSGSRRSSSRGRSRLRDDDDDDHDDHHYYHRSSESEYDKNIRMVHQDQQLNDSDERQLNDSFREEKIRIVDYLTSMDGGGSSIGGGGNNNDGSSRRSNASDVLDAAAAAATGSPMDGRRSRLGGDLMSPVSSSSSRRGEETEEGGSDNYQGSIIDDHHLYAAKPKGRSMYGVGSSSRRHRDQQSGYASLPGAVRVGRPAPGRRARSYSGSTTASAASGGSTRFVGGGRNFSVKQQQLHAARNIVQQQDRRSTRSNFFGRTSTRGGGGGKYHRGETVDSSDSFMTISNENLSTRGGEEEEEEGGSWARPSTQSSPSTGGVEMTQFRDPEPWPMTNNHDSDTIDGTFHTSWKNFSRREATMIITGVCGLLTAIVLVFGLFAASSKNGDHLHNGEYTSCGDLKKIPDIWVQCGGESQEEEQNNNETTSTSRIITGIPTCQREMYATIRSILAQHFKDTEFSTTNMNELEIDSCDTTNMALLSLAEQSPMIYSTMSSTDNILLLHNNLAQKFALACLYYSTRGNEWFLTSNWLSSSKASHCIWHGIVCDDYDNIVEIDLRSNKLKGTIPSELSILTEMKSLLISDGHLEGTIPSEVYHSLSNLMIISLGHNLLEEISTEIGKLESLTTFEFEFNRLRGTTIPTEVGLLSNLQVFDCESCQLGGNIPTELGECKELVILELGTNYIGGILPSEIGQATGLLILQITDNRFDTQTIPNELYSLSELIYLDLSGNEFTGPALPSTMLSNLTNLRRIDLGGMTLSGTLPTTDFVHWQNSLELLFLGVNRIHGTIPSEMGVLTRLRSLTLYNNDLSGFVPSELGLLTELSILNLGYNPLDLKNIPLEVQELIDNNGISIGVGDIPPDT